MAESLALTLTLASLRCLVHGQVVHGTRQHLVAILLPSVWRIPAVSCENHVDGAQPPGSFNLLLLLLRSSLERRHGATSANEVGVVGIDVRALDADQTLNVIRGWSQALTEEVGDNLNQLGVESREARKILKTYG